MESDVLVEIVDDNLPKLASLYEKHTHWAPHLLNLIDIGIKWKKSDKFRDCISFKSPNLCWEEYGTIVVLLDLHRYVIFVFSLDDNCINLIQGLQRTRSIDYSKRGTFYCVHEKHIPFIMKFIEDKDLNVSQSTIPCLMYAMSPQDAAKLTVTCPPELYIKKLEPRLAKEIDSVWPHRFPGSQDFISGLIEMNGGYDLFLKNSDEMVAWVVKDCFGHVGLLQTGENHKRRGYASLVTRILAKEIGEEGLWPFGAILESNSASISMFEKLGFQKVGKCVYI